MSPCALIIALAAAGRLDNPMLGYLDPGSGSLILQGVIAAVAAIGLTARLWWKRLLVLLRIRKPSSSLPDSSAAEPDRKTEES